MVYIRVLELEDDFGEEVVEYLLDLVVNKFLFMKVEDKDIIGGKVRGKGIGICLIVILIDLVLSKII